MIDRTRKKVLFGHQSVGDNILSGIASLEPSIVICGLDASGENKALAAIYQAKIGQNGKPIEKLRHFENILCNSRIQFDIALMKLCYVDITSQTNVPQLFDRYVSSVREISANLPNTSLLHCTVPIRVIRSGLRTLLRHLFGHSIEALDANDNREEFNGRIREMFAGDDRLLDIARLEATFPNGASNTLRYRGREVAAMCPAYSSDGGHLNDLGQKILATEFLRLTGMQR